MATATEQNIMHLPVLALRGLVVFPKTVLSLDIGRSVSFNAINFAMKKDQLIYAVSQKEAFIDEPNQKDLYSIGCVVRIKQVLKISEGVMKVLVEGLYRAKHQNFNSENKYYTADVVKCEEKEIKNREIYIETFLRKIKSQFEKYVLASANINEDIIKAVAKINEISFLCDFIAFNIPAPYDDKQYVLEQLSPISRAKILLELLDKEREISLIDNKINIKTKMAIEEGQKEYYLREQIKAISNELYGDETADEIDKYHQKIEELSASDKIKDSLHSEVIKLSKMPGGSHEGSVIRSYLDTCLELPWGKLTSTNTNIQKSLKILDRDIYGMEKVKDRILEMLSVFVMSPDIKGQIICLVGPPGVGKTSIGKTIAECMGRNFARISLGGVHDEAEIRGHRKTYIGAMPGKIISAVKQAGSDNALLLLDEVDKLGDDYKGDPSSALLEVLDPEQNDSFVDHYIDLPYDLSHTVFIATANTTETIPSPLLDRMEVIELTGYTREEKFNIAKKHLLSKEINRHGLTTKNIRITDDALYSLIDFYTREAGVRKLERSIASLCRKSARILAENGSKRVVVNASDVEKMLGKRKYKPEVILDHDEVGIINGLAWTSVGGEIMQLEVASMPGTGKVELTGSLGDVMKESAMAAVSYVRANCKQYNIDGDFYKNRDIHIHATEAAVPKDGPSAGVTMTVGIVSALSGLPVKRDIAMTGEVTIRGRVLPIGGLREKTMAAYTGGVKTVFIPKENVSDLDEVDTTVKENIKFIPVSNVNEIIENALVNNHFSQEDNKNIIFDHNTSNGLAETISQ